MATSSSTLLPSLIPATTPSINSPKNHLFLLQNRSLNRSKRVSLVVHAVKPPAGVKLLLLLLLSFPFLVAVEFPKVEPQFKPPFLGFTRTAEIWNSRACMIGIIGVFVVEFIINKGILQVIGVDVGKGLNLPL
ncbi:Light-harvesting complex-like protein [Vigna angularis]|uniref:Light-harvesting complex-like protein n=1 Tax=Phaseolus angularis TaxID=3914 RepID=A0A8T0KZT8_PHAAN|nr:Light-harvesting complex-like protein [Vigna angularis]